MQGTPLERDTMTSTRRIWILTGAVLALVAACGSDDAIDGGAGGGSGATSSTAPVNSTRAGSGLAELTVPTCPATLLSLAENPGLSVRSLK